VELSRFSTARYTERRICRAATSLSTLKAVRRRARSQEGLQSQAHWRVAVSSLVSPCRKHRGNAKGCSGDDLSIRGRGCCHHGCPGPKNANASGSRRRMTPLSRCAPVLRFALSGQRFVRRSQARAACQTASPQFLPFRASCFHWSMIVEPDIRRGPCFVAPRNPDAIAARSS
jgi:hypothetical protein